MVALRLLPTVKHNVFLYGAVFGRQKVRATQLFLFLRPPGHRSENAFCVSIGNPQATQANTLAMMAPTGSIRYN
jgi:hypothetical protein